LEVNITCLHKKVKPNRKLIEKWLKKVVDIEDKKLGEINFILTSDSHILDLNRKFLNHDYFTDVITFNDNIGDILIGDIFISVDTVEQNGEIFGEGLYRELLRVMVHGVLHLIGYKDSTDREKEYIRKTEDYYLMMGEDSFNLSSDGFRKNI